jgi:glucose-6-phosphate isomerase
MPETQDTVTPREASLSQSALRLDYAGMMAPMVGPGGGIAPDHLHAMQESASLALKCILERTGAGSEFLGWLDLPEQSQSDLEALQAEADRLASLGDLHVVLGIGGSYLGTRATIDACLPLHRDHLARSARGSRPRILYGGHLLDADALAGLLAQLPSSPVAEPERGFTVHVVSKSGTTLETSVATRMVIARLKEVHPTDWKDRLVITTDPQQGVLRELVRREGLRSYPVASDVGGRYSVLSPVGLLSAAVAGVDIRALVAGAREMAARCRRPELNRNPALLHAALQVMSARAGRTVSVMAAWTQRLETVTFWYDQLCAESIGKDGQGRVPVATVNTRDLHSRGQEVQDGARNCVVTNLVVERPDEAIQLPGAAGYEDGLDWLNTSDLHEMTLKAHAGTCFAYQRDGRPNMTLYMPRLDAHSLGQLFFLFEFSTVAEGYMLGINPLDQPGVEAYKRFMLGNLGKPGLEDARSEFEERPMAPEGTFEVC